MWCFYGVIRVNIRWINMVTGQNKRQSIKASHFAPDLGSASGIGSGSFRKWSCEIQSKYFTALLWSMNLYDTWKVVKTRGKLAKPRLPWYPSQNQGAKASHFNTTWFVPQIWRVVGFCVNEPPHQLWQGSVQQPQECSSAFKNCHQL